MVRYSTMEDLITPKEVVYTPGIEDMAEGKVRYYAKHRQAHEREIRRLLAVQEQQGGSLSVEQQEQLDQCWVWYWAEHADVLRW